MGVHLIGQGDLGMGTRGKHLAVCYREVRINVIKQESKRHTAQSSNLEEQEETQSELNNNIKSQAHKYMYIHE